MRVYVFNFIMSVYNVFRPSQKPGTIISFSQSWLKKQVVSKVSNSYLVILVSVKCRSNNPFMVIADVLAEMKIIIQSGTRLSTDERNLLCVAYKNLTNTTRNSWRIVETVSRAESSGKSALLQKQQNVYQQNLTNICMDAIQLLDDNLLPKASNGEEKVFWGKM
jgi:hypothetical protein